MAKKKAVIRNRYATETLGIVDTIITDKTGTITENTMTVQEIILPDQEKISITGIGWSAKGEFFQKEKQITPLENKSLSKLLRISSICNNSKIIKQKNVAEYKIIGDPTEAALLVLAEKGGLKQSDLSKEINKIDDLPFNPELKYHASLSVLTEHEDKKQICVIGAPESIIKHSAYILKNGRKAKLTSKDISELTEKVDSMTNKAMRVLAFAYKEVPSHMKEIEEKDAEELIVVGIAGMLDPPRPEVKEAIAKAKGAGIRVIMATGDHKNTAVAIAKEIGLVSHLRDEKYPLALTGQELKEMSKKEFGNAVKNVSIFARLTPETKLKIAKTLQDQKHIVAMTGDGVNDAPALKQADIGISMGLIGTDVAREASSMVLADDNFASIISAVEEGRTVFINTRQTSFFLITTSFAQYATIISTLLIGMPLPLLPLQILWLNLVTGGVTDVALATEKSHHDVLTEKPRNKKENILNKELFPFLALMTITMLILTLVVFNYYLPEQTKARTAAFAVMSFTQLFNMFNLRSLNRSLFKIGVLTNKYVLGAFFLSLLGVLAVIYVPFMQNTFSFTSLSIKEIFLMFIISSVVLWFGEGYKLLKKKKKNIPIEE